MINLYKIMISTMLMIVFLMAMIPSIATYGSPAVANQLNLTVGNASSGLQSMVIANITKVSFGNCNYPSTQCNNTNRTTGFFANTNLFTGAAFVINGIGYIMQALLNIPGIINVLLSVTLSAVFVNIPVNYLYGDIALLIGLITSVLVILGLSYFGKYNLREGVYIPFGSTFVIQKLFALSILIKLEFAIGFILGLSFINLIIFYKRKNKVD